MSTRSEGSPDTAWEPIERLVRLLPDGPSGQAAGDLVGDLASTTSGGKGIRRALFRDVYRAAGGSADEGARRMETVVEVLHEALLVHDDVADRDHVRRGAPNVVGRTVARAGDAGLGDEAACHLGTVAGLLAGDLLLVTAFAELSRVPMSDPVRSAVWDEVERALVVTVAGELEDVVRSLGDVPTDRATTLAVAVAKTAEYSFVLPMVTAAVMAGCGPSTVEALRSAGRDLGTAYQVMDDVLGVFGDPEVTGKSVDSDLRRRVPTVILAHGRAHPSWPEISAALDDDPERARGLLADTGAREAAFEVARTCALTARSHLGHPDVPPAVAAAIEPRVHAVIDRRA